MGRYAGFGANVCGRSNAEAERGNTGCPGSIVTRRDGSLLSIKEGVGVFPCLGPGQLLERAPSQRLPLFPCCAGLVVLSRCPLKIPHNKPQLSGAQQRYAR